MPVRYPVSVRSRTQMLSDMSPHHKPHGHVLRSSPKQVRRPDNALPVFTVEHIQPPDNSMVIKICNTWSYSLNNEN